MNLLRTTRLVWVRLSSRSLRVLLCPVPLSRSMSLVARWNSMSSFRLTVSTFRVAVRRAPLCFAPLQNMRLRVPVVKLRLASRLPAHLLGRCMPVKLQLLRSPGIGNWVRCTSSVCPEVLSPVSLAVSTWLTVLSRWGAVYLSALLTAVPETNRSSVCLCSGLGLACLPPRPICFFRRR